MTTYYKGNNIGLEYDAATGTWGFKNIAQDFVDTNTFSTADPSFEYAPVVDDDEDEQDNSTVCPPGYIYDETLKQCVPDPNYQNPFAQQQSGRREDEPEGLHIPSNETKELWIKNANTIIPAGQEGAGKTGYQNFIDNLKDRGWIKTENGKMIFKKDNIGSALGQAGLSRFGMHGEVEAKTNKIIKDLQRMGGINAAITMDDDGEIDFASELELANSPGTFATYNYDGTDLMGGNYTGFTTPATHSLGVKTFATWDDYMAAIMKPFTSTSTEITKTKLSAGDRMDAELAEFKRKRDAAKAEKERLKKEAELAEFKRKKDAAEKAAELAEFKRKKDAAEKAKAQAEREERLRKRQEEKDKGTGGSWGGGQDDRPVIKPSDKPKDTGGCFHPYQLIENKFMKEFEPGDLINGKEIIGMIKLKLNEDMYSINDVKVTGSHGMKYKDKWIFVADHPDSFRIDDKPKFVYIPIIETGTFTINNEEFADYDYHDIVVLGDEEWKKRRGFSVAA